jgi:hypothetical protein
MSKGDTVAKLPARSALVRVKPVDGLFINNVPAIEQDVLPEVAQEYVATGAFIEVEVDTSTQAAAQPDGAAEEEV